MSFLGRLRPAAAPGRRRNPVARFFLDDFGLKLLALLTSFFIFYLVRGAEDAQRSFFVDVLVLLPEESERVLMSDVPEQVRVTVQGTRSLLNTIERNDLGPLQMDLRFEEPGYYYFDSSDLDLASGLRVVQLAPASVPLRWEDRVEREVAVFAATTGSPPAGLSLLEPVEVTPRRVTLRGPRSVVDGIDVLQTSEIPVNGLGEGVHERRASVPLQDPRLRISGEPNVGVTLVVETERAERAFPPAPVAVPSAPVRTRVRPPRVIVTLTGPPEVVAKIRPESIIPSVDASDVLPGSRDVPLRVEVRGLPAQVTMRATPQEVLVTLPRGIAGPQPGSSPRR